MQRKNFTRKNLYNKIYKVLGFSKRFSSKIVDSFFETIISDLINSGKVKISSFGTFQILNKKERLGRNPKTKVESIISSRKVVKFKPAIFVKKKINT